MNYEEMDRATELEVEQGRTPERLLLHHKTLRDLMIDIESRFRYTTPVGWSGKEGVTIKTSVGVPLRVIADHRIKENEMCFVNHGNGTAAVVDIEKPQSSDPDFDKGFMQHLKEV